MGFRPCCVTTLETAEWKLLVGVRIQRNYGEGVFYLRLREKGEMQIVKGMRQQLNWKSSCGLAMKIRESELSKMSMHQLAMNLRETQDVLFMTDDDMSQTESIVRDGKRPREEYTTENTDVVGDATMLVRLDKAINNYLEKVGPVVAKELAVVKCTGIIGFFRCEARFRFIVAFVDENNKECQLTFQRAPSVTAGLHAGDEFFKHANKWPKHFAIVGSWDKPFLGKSGEVMMRNFSSTGMIRPADSVETDFQCVFAFGLPIGAQMSVGISAVPAWKVTVVSSTRDQNKQRTVRFTIGNVEHTLLQYAIKNYDQVTLENGKEYLLMGVKQYRDGLANGSCCQFIPKALFEEAVWKSFAVTHAFVTVDSIVTSDCM